MKKILLIVVVLLFNTKVFSKSIEYYCTHSHGVNYNQEYITYLIKANINSEKEAYTLENKIVDQWRKYIKSLGITPNNSELNCWQNSIYNGITSLEKTISDYETGYLKGRIVTRINWKPVLKTKKKRIIKTKPQKTIVTNSNDYTNEDWWKNATLEQVKQAIRNGLNPNELFGNAKETALHLAIYSNNPEIIEYVIKSGANINAKNKHGKTPLDYAEYGKNDETIDTLKRMAKSLRYKRTPFANECVSIPARKNKYNNSRDIKNTCNFWVNVWVCDKGYQYGCDSRKGLIDAYINEGDGRRNQVYGDNHFTGLVTLKAGEQQGTGSDREKYTMNYFACKGRYSHIVNDKKGATGFKCRTREDLLDKYGWGE